LPIQRGGVKGLRYPVAVTGSDGAQLHTVATFSMDVGLEHNVKGNHMSRFVEILERLREPLDLRALRALHAQMLLQLSRDPRIGPFSVASENFESIHNHSAYAEIRGLGAALMG